MKKDKNILLAIFVGMFCFFVLFFIQKGSYSIDNRSIKSLSLRSSTVCDFISDQNYCINNLNASIYITDVNSDKWAVLIHGYTSSSSSMLQLSSSYIENGYNIIATDNRGHGKSGGEVAWGYLESLDVYDWIKDLDSNWNDLSRYGVNVAPDTIVVHGVSLGGATTLQLATNPDIAAADGTEPYTKNLTDLNVKGFINDCGYVSIFDLAVKEFSISKKNTSSNTINNVLDGLYGETLSAYGMGIPYGEFEKYEYVFSDGRKFPENSKIVVIHGTNDSVVPYSNSQIVVNNISPGILLYNWIGTGYGHVFAASDSQIENYNKLISKFLQCVTNDSCTSIR